MNPEEVMQKYEKYINPSSTRLFRFMGLSSVEARAEGWIITDTEGAEFIDCLGGFGMFAVGHKHPKVVEAVERELHNMPMCGKVLFNEPAATCCPTGGKTGGNHPGRPAVHFFLQQWDGSSGRLPEGGASGDRPQKVRGGS